MLLFATALLLSAGFSQHARLPQSVVGCLASHPEVKLDSSQKPSHLRLFFTRSRLPDYVVAVRERESKLPRALVCMHGGKHFLLGATANGQPFSDMKNDNYMSSDWRVCSKKDVLKMRRYYQGVPEPVNEAICLLWEDGEALIYFDGKEFQWKSLAP